MNIHDVIGDSPIRLCSTGDLWDEDKIQDIYFLDNKIYVCDFHGEIIKYEDITTIIDKIKSNS